MSNALVSQTNNIANLEETHNVHAMRRITIQKADGSSKMYEKSMDYISNESTFGDQHFTSTCKNGSKNPIDHMHTKKSELTFRSKLMIDDGQGNITTDEEAYKFEDSFATQGTKLIGSKPRKETDARPKLIEAFSGGSSNLLSYKGV